MTNAPMPLPTQRMLIAQKLAIIVSGICLIGFIIDIVVIGLPPNPLSPQWRLNFLQQVAERSLLLFVGSVLLFYSKLEGRLQQLRIISITCLVVGLILGLSSLIVIKDNFTLQQQAIASINSQATELRNRIIQGREDPTLRQKIDPDAFTAALGRVDSQAATLKQETQTGAMKTLLSVAGNLLLVGGGLVGVGRLGLLRSQTRQRRMRV